MSQALVRMALALALMVALVGVAAPAMAAERSERSPAPLAVSQEGEGEGEAAGDEGDGGGITIDVVPVTLWTLAAVAGLCVVGGVFYLFKRRVGGFPKNPSWVAPISIMESRDFPDEGDFGDALPDAHGHH